MYENTAASPVYTVNAEQHDKLGLPARDTNYTPDDFVNLLARAQYVHDVLADKAIDEERSDQLRSKAAAGIAQSVAVGVMNRVVANGNAGNNVSDPLNNVSGYIYEHFEQASALRTQTGLNPPKSYGYLPTAAIKLAQIHHLQVLDQSPARALPRAS
jgi:hypothetical protein